MNGRERRQVQRIKLRHRPTITASPRSSAIATAPASWANAVQGTPFALGTASETVSGSPVATRISSCSMSMCSHDDEPAKRRIPANSQISSSGRRPVHSVSTNTASLMSLRLRHLTGHTDGGAAVKWRSDRASVRRLNLHQWLIFLPRTIFTSTQFGLFVRAFTALVRSAHHGGWLAVRM
jgi:hypothetical protein